MAALLALAGALAFGISDFIGGVVSRRTSVWPVALTASLGSVLGTVALAVAIPGHPAWHDLAWGLLGGIGSGAGTVFLYRGLAAGRMGVVAPVSAVGAALIPAVLGVAVGERLSALVLVGLLVAFPGIWLVSREPADGGQPGGSAPGLVDGVLAGLGFGLLFATVGQVPDSAGLWPVLGTQVVCFLTVGATAYALGGDPVPRRRQEWAGLVAGLFAALAVLGFLLARQRGLLSIAAVLTSLYPAFTVLLATLVLRERLHRGQSAGLALCAVTVVCVALG